MGRTAIGPVAMIAVAAVIVAGCTQTRVGGLNTQPAPLTPAPAGTVTSGQLPPPASPQVGADGFPEAPGGSQIIAGDGTDGETSADGDLSSIQEVASAAPVTRETMVGAWRVSTEGANCQMFMALTRWSTGFRAASRGCPGDAANVSSWNVEGNQVLLSDSSGNRVATLFSTGGERFDGQTVGGRAISLAR